MDNIKKKTFEFFKSFGITSVTTDILRDIIQRQGYSIFEFSHFDNDPETEQLLNSLKLRKYSLNTKAFTYADNNNRIVFILEGLSCEEELILLAHEEGHIYLNHLNMTSGIFGDDILKEQEANNFAFYLLSKNFFRTILLNAGFHKVTAVIVTVSVLLILGFSIAVANKASVPVSGIFSSNTLVVTANGTKYHRPDCVYVKNKTNITHLAIKELEELGYTPCKVCLPD